jgi:hypothetical protein
MKIKIELEVDTENPSDMESIEELLEIIERLKQGDYK